MKQLQQIVVVPATLSDHAEFVGLCELWRQESEFSGMPVDREKVTKILDNLRKMGGIVLVAKAGPRVVGVIAGAVVERWFSAERMAQVFIAHVDPEFRADATMDLLIWELQAQAVAAGCSSVELVAVCHPSAAALRAAMDRSGFQPMAEHFRWLATFPDSESARAGSH